MKFYMSNYSSNTVMHCATQQETEMFLQYLHDHGMTWQSGDSYIDYFEHVPSDICLRFHAGVRGDFDAYSRDKNITILEFRDFDWEEDELHTVENFALDGFLGAFKRI